MEEESERPNLEQMVRVWIDSYRVPIIFCLLAIFLLGSAAIIWQLNNQSAKVSFTQETTATASSRIKVDIEGAVAIPGVYELAASSRIQDLLIEAGGLSAEADRDWLSKNLNLAAKLIDGGKIFIPKVGEVTAGKIEDGKLKMDGQINKVFLRININSASSAELDTLPGVGPVTVQKIIDGRPYQTLDELVSRKILGKAIFDKIKNELVI